MSWPYDPLSGLWQIGVAYGQANIKGDSMGFIFKGETFEFPTFRIHGFARWNGHFYEANVDDLRRLEADSAGG